MFGLDRFDDQNALSEENEALHEDDRASNLQDHPTEYRLFHTPEICDARANRSLLIVIPRSENQVPSESTKTLHNNPSTPAIEMHKATVRAKLKHWFHIPKPLPVR
tara:strand:- start:41388 stop:41705 length:318 start_codon:yes stop_codon:yes gene_type:complete